MKKILVIGPGGAGKSTFARKFGERLAIDVVHLDAHYWRPGWVETNAADWEKKIDEIIAGESWVMDGNYSGTLQKRLQACDTVVFLDLPRSVCAWRVIKRYMQRRGETRPDMAPGCPERFSLRFLLWVWNYPKRSRQKILDLLDEFKHCRRIVQLSSSQEVSNFLATLDHQKRLEHQTPPKQNHSFCNKA